MDKGGDIYAETFREPASEDFRGFTIGRIGSPGRFKSNQDYRLYLFLLVTPGTPQLFLQIVSDLWELHHVTDDDVLVIGPRLDTSHVAAGPGRLDRFLSLLQESAALQRDYGRRLTKASYEFARQLGARRSIVPSFVLFDNVRSLEDYVYWPLAEESPAHVIPILRAALDYLDEHCGWQTLRQISDLKRKIAGCLQAQAHCSSQIERLGAKLAEFDDQIADLKRLSSVSAARFHVGLEALSTTISASQKGRAAEPDGKRLRTLLSNVRDRPVSESFAESFGELRRYRPMVKKQYSGDILRLFNRLTTFGSEFLETIASVENAKRAAAEVATERTKCHTKLSELRATGDDLEHRIRTLKDLYSTQNYPDPLHALIRFDPDRFKRHTDRSAVSVPGPLPGTTRSEDSMSAGSRVRIEIGQLLASLHLEGDIHMRDQYIVKQGAVIGPNANVVAGEIKQTLSEQPLDLAVLAAELSALQEAMRRQSKGTDENRAAIAAVSEAEGAAKRGDQSSAMLHLGRAGQWALEVATKIGSSVASDAIKSTLGL